MGGPPHETRLCSVPALARVLRYRTPVRRCPATARARRFLREKPCTTIRAPHSGAHRVPRVSAARFVFSCGHDRLVLLTGPYIYSIGMAGCALSLAMRAVFRVALAHSFTNCDRRRRRRGARGRRMAQCLTINCHVLVCAHPAFFDDSFVNECTRVAPLLFYDRPRQVASHNKDRT